MNSSNQQNLNDNPNNQKNVNISKFLIAINVSQFPGLTIHQITATNRIRVALNTEYVHFDMNLSFPLNFTFNVKAALPKKDLDINMFLISKLRINIENEDIKQELKSYTNYLQRQRNIILSLSVLRNFSILLGERKLILDMLSLHSETYITNQNYEEGGIAIKCEDKRSGFKFFESVWKIQFDCSNHLVMDCIDFSVTLRNEIFHKSVTEAMNKLIKPTLSYDEKVKLWWIILHALAKAITQEALIKQPWESRDFLKVGNVQEVNLCNTEEQFEIIDESDDENCIVIDD